ncbi:MAG: superoxide dismutase [Amphiplicatus sp.]
MAFTLSPLPYAASALSPHISAQTLDFHHGKHHKGYVEKLNTLIEGKPEEEASLEEIIRESAGDEASRALFNNAGQVWNHDFYWRSMRPQGGGEPEGDIAKMIEADFGGLDGFKEAFSEAGTSQFGSGWAWLVVKDGKLDLRKTPNAQSPLTEPGATPLLTMDVWEHAYYLDYQNKRAEYVKVFLDKLVNWAFANENLAKA